MSKPVTTRKPKRRHPPTTPKAPRRRNGQPVFRSFDDLPLTITLDEVCAVYRRARSTVLRDLRAGVFVPPPFDHRPYRWRKEDVRAHLEQKVAAARERQAAQLMARATARDPRPTT